ncbi:MAG: class I mannose-6-phosphate isomerase [Oscillospiraceae bacterium]|nr:class I mannose-6-phosphate isomerase [Oscillospiraceae bacterium]
MYILKLKPAFKDYLWGGTRLRDDYGFDSTLEKLAEGWMLSCHKDGENTIENGKFEGQTLSDVVKANPEFLGIHGNNFEYFPILIKLIDAKNDLSVQVHPDNDYALRVEKEYGKTECWYILDCDEGAELIYGFNREISSEEFKQRIEDNTFLDTVNKVKVKKGDLFFIEAGTLHAIGKGIFLAEIQQNSNSTYRVYDYGRLGADGKPRPLHIDKAIDVTKCTPPDRGTDPEGEEIKCDGYTKQLLTKCDLFHVERIQIEKNYVSVADEKSFVSVLVTDGSGEIEGMKIKKGDSLFIPANYGKFEITGNIDLIMTRV